ncbi:MAG: hypothetical protein UY70_C0015G0002 [Candidatus Kaiserbacteria bacterium GW2011_GWB1_52_6]|uniref:Uncharacterized protein n=2 Tax=Candidatus Kaiseribacteriota TaxID=1752734 RepID=A0A0G1X8M1_9BACT|nr:MAG: hypothetical protein UY67_C0009G0029 [Candidatus Kaiserbacteria bacterium GW2011_GWA2_52_12]KKW27381.1 MAG: hypothetical protein UY70_C0015G0002 [Candidatus Kaiserbacteria bacterium GW2011_GWB1_52_6]
MLLKDVPLHELKIGQVVRFTHSGKFAFICEITAEVPQNVTPEYQAGRWYAFPRFSTVTCFHENGKVSQPFFYESHDGVEVINRIIAGQEMFNFPEFVQRESANWKNFC